MGRPRGSQFAALSLSPTAWHMWFIMSSKRRHMCGQSGTHSPSGGPCLTFKASAVFSTVLVL